MKSYIGIDVSKHRLDVDWLGKPMEFTNDTRGIRQLIKRLALLSTQEQLALVLCEASGGYEQAVAQACQAKQIPFHVAHANHVKYFAKSQGIKAKTDKLDAKLITAYGVERKPVADRFLLSQSAEKMRALVKRREQLLLDKKREQNRLDKLDLPEITRLVRAHITWLDKAIKDVDDRLAVVQTAEEIHPTYALLTSSPGIGNVLAYYLITQLPELGKVPPNALAALVGVAPFNHDSGKQHGKRFIQGGRAALRQKLYMAAMTSITYNPELKRFYQRLIEAGKPGKVALVAVMRKLVLMANSILSRQTPWQEHAPKASVSS